MEIKLNDMIGEYGLYATQPYAQGDVLFVLSGEIFANPTREPIYVGDGIHIHDPFGIYINHSFNPSVRIESYNVRAARDINAGDEITFDYNQNEIQMANPFYSDGILVCGKSNELSKKLIDKMRRIK